MYVYKTVVLGCGGGTASRASGGFFHGRQETGPSEVVDAYISQLPLFSSDMPLRGHSNSENNETLSKKGNNIKVLLSA